MAGTFVAITDVIIKGSLADEPAAVPASRARRALSHPGSGSLLVRLNTSLSFPNCLQERGSGVKTNHHRVGLARFRMVADKSRDGHTLPRRARPCFRCAPGFSVLMRRVTCGLPIYAPSTTPWNPSPARKFASACNPAHRQSRLGDVERLILGRAGCDQPHLLAGPCLAQPKFRLRARARHGSRHICEFLA